MDKVEPSFLFFDIETVEDPDRKEDGSPDDAGREAGGAAATRSFPPLHRHKIITIGALWLSERYFFKKLGIFSEGKDEVRLLRDFNGFVSEKKPTIVSYNGRRFDLPVILLRSLKHGVSMEWYLRSQEYSRRYPPTRHLDLCDILSDHGAATFTSLDNISTLVGLGGKKGMDGAMVQGEYDKGNLAGIQSYCLGDVVMTACVFLRYLLVAGELPPAHYNDCLQSCIDGIRKDGRLEGTVSGEELARLKVPVE
jgi:predicted PolB exonuclease-like 3'-5' exonuclease